MIYKNNIFFNDGTVKDIALKLLEKGEKLLDLGGGRGDCGEAVKASSLYKEIYGVDVDFKLLEESKERGLVINRCDLNKGALPFKCNYFDAITCLEVIEHIINPHEILREVNRILKPGGIFIISTPNIQWIYHIFRLILGYGPSTSFPDSNIFRYYRSNSYDGGHVKYFTKRDLCNLMISSNFIINQIRLTYTVNSPILKRLIKLCINIPILKYFLSPGIVIKARKTRKEENMLC